MNALALTVILVHGGFVDASGWQAVQEKLTHDGYNVMVTQQPTASLQEDVAYTKRVVDAAPGPVLLVGHSYGGAIITEAGNSPKVRGLVYVAAFAPDKDESIEMLIKNPVPGAPVPPILPPQDGFLLLDQAKFAASFAADVDPKTSSFMAKSQVPWGLKALSDKVTEASWHAKPSYYLVAKNDKMIPPEAQRQMSQRINATVIEVPGSHAVYVSQPKAVAELIERAAKELSR
jgi:pimeloyl-ACP methyl ester carboxylesterase